MKKLIVSLLLISSTSFANSYFRCAIKGKVDTIRTKNNKVLKTEYVNLCVLGDAILRVNKDGSEYKASCSFLNGGPMTIADSGYDVSITSSISDKVTMGLKETLDMKISVKTKYKGKVHTKDGSFEMNYGHGIFQRNLVDLSLPFEKVSKRKHKQLSELTVDCAKPGHILSNKKNVNDDRRQLEKDFKERNTTKSRKSNIVIKDK